MKKVLYELAPYPSILIYADYKELHHNYSELYYLYLALNPIEDMDVKIEKIEKIVVIWSSNFFKETLRMYNLDSSKEAIHYEQLYLEYFKKRWLEKPQITLLLSDYNDLKEKWKIIKSKSPKFIIMTLQNGNLYDTASIEEKDSLSENDLAELNHNHAQYLRWKKAEELYNYDYDIIDDVWRSPADSVFQEDIEKYLDQETGFIQHSIYTKQQIIDQLQKKLKTNEPPHMIIHWLAIRSNYEITESDQAFSELLSEFSSIDFCQNYENFTHKKLQKIADYLSLGQGVILQNMFDNGES